MPAVVIANPTEVYQGTNTQVVQDGSATLTVTGSAVVRGFGVGEVTLFANIGSNPTGTGPFISFTIIEVDPIDETTAIGNPSTTSNFTSAIGGIVQRVPCASSGTFKVSWNIGGTSPSFTNVKIHVSGKPIVTKLVDSNGEPFVFYKAMHVQNAPNKLRVNRINVGFYAVAPAVADTLLSLVKTTNGVAAAGATSISAAGGTVLRVNTIIFNVRANAAAAANAIFTIRQNPSGATVIGSPTELRISLGLTAATIGSSLNAIIPYDEGWEITGAQTFGISLSAQAITNIISISMQGYEYYTT